MIQHYLLSLLIWLPILGGILVLMSDGENYPDRARVIALIISLATLGLAGVLVAEFSTHTSAMQFQEFAPWIKAYGIYYSLGVDGISMPMIVLTCFTTLLVVLAAWKTIKFHVGEYMATFLLMQGMIIGAFASLDSILFYIFWEGMLIPMYLSIGIWGGQDRSYASIKFFLYTFFGSALMLVVFLYLHTKANSYAIVDFYPIKLTMREQNLIFIAFLLAFAVKVPMWPVHTWLPDAHTEAPAGGSVILAALMLKLGAYGFLRFSLPIVTDACHSLDWLMLTLSLIAIVYIGIVALAQTDMKKLIAYSSIAHMGFVTLGCFMVFRILETTGNLHRAYMTLEGAMVQMLSHAFGAGAMFLGVGILYHYLHTREIKDFGGIASKMPIFSAFFMLFAMSNAGLPGTSGFVGEFMVILGSFQDSPMITATAALTLILGAAYTLYMYKRVFFGEVVNPRISTLVDIDWLDKAIFILLALPLLILGLYPDVLLKFLHPTFGHLLNLSLQSKLP
jgi:NADH-quinone oxidoreductase subunit M